MVVNSKKEKKKWNGYKKFGWDGGSDLDGRGRGGGAGMFEEDDFSPFFFF